MLFLIRLLCKEAELPPLCSLGLACDKRGNISDSTEYNIIITFTLYCTFRKDYQGNLHNKTDKNTKSVFLDEI